METIDHLTTSLTGVLRELDTRITTDGDRVTLLWNDEADTLELVIEPPDGLASITPVRRERGHDAFWHPYLYEVRTH